MYLKPAGEKNSYSIIEGILHQCSFIVSSIGNLFLKCLDIIHKEWNFRDNEKGRQAIGIAKQYSANIGLQDNTNNAVKYVDQMWSNI